MSKHLYWILLFSILSINTLYSHIARYDISTDERVEIINTGERTINDQYQIEEVKNRSINIVSRTTDPIKVPSISIQPAEDGVSINSLSFFSNSSAVADYVSLGKNQETSQCLSERFYYEIKTGFLNHQRWNSPRFSFHYYRLGEFYANHLTSLL